MKTRILPEYTADQRGALEKFSKTIGGALFMEMGTGKTAAALAIIARKAHKIDRIVWIAPASLNRDESYVREIERWNTSGKEVVFFNSEGIGASDTKFGELADLARRETLYCVLDESSDFRNIEANRTARIISIRDRFKYRLILNGTPIMKNVVDIWAQMQFVHPNILPMTEEQFAQNFCIFENNGQSGRSWRRWSKPANEEALAQKIAPYVYEATLALKVRKTEHHHYCGLTAKENEAYNELKRDYIRGLSGASFLAIAQVFQKQYTICASKTKRLMQSIKEATARGEQSIVFVKFLAEAEYYADMIEGAVIFTGENKDDLPKFEQGAPVLISTFGCGSRGHNWQFANNVFFASMTFDWGMMQQSLHRAYRTGQTRDVAVHHFKCDTGLDDLMELSAQKKTTTAQNFARLVEKCVKEKGWEGL